MVKHDLHNRFYESQEEFQDGLTESLTNFNEWSSNLSDWIDTFNSRKSYIFGQFDWNIDNGESEEVSKLKIFNVCDFLFSETHLTQWRNWSKIPQNWGHYLHGSRNWLRFNDIMDKLININENVVKMTDDHKISAVAWMQFFSGKPTTDFSYGTWAWVSHCSNSST